MKRKPPTPRAKAAMVIGGALLCVAGIAAMAYSIFVWMLPKVDVGFADHILVLAGMVGATIGGIIFAAGLVRETPPS